MLGDWKPLQFEKRGQLGVKIRRIDEIPNTRHWQGGENKPRTSLWIFSEALDTAITYKTGNKPSYGRQTLGRRSLTSLAQ